MIEKESIEALYHDFITKLKKRYGAFSEEHKRFEVTSNSEIARDLNYSDAQFSRLINKSATDGEYVRAIRNIERILNELHLKQELEKALSKSRMRAGGKIPLKQKILLLAIGFVVASSVFIILYLRPGQDQQTIYAERDQMLKWSFETAFVSPYTKLRELPEDCNFPCYKYQGRWALKRPYKLPFFRERNGFHYLATEVNMYARCMSEKQPNGTLIEGYEYQKHEIWYDKRELPIDSFVTLDSRRDILPSYQELDFAQDPNFVKIAYVHTFFKNEFELKSDTIQRFGKVIGRDIEFIPDEELTESLGSERKVRDISNEINRIVINRLEDFSKPISCKTTFAPDPDFNRISEGDEINFDCTLTTGRVPMNYLKTYIFEDQYIKNDCQPGS